MLFHKYGGFKFLLSRNCDQEILEKARFSNFYHLLLHCFAELKSSYNPQESDLALVIFNNRYIRINGGTFFFFLKWEPA